MKVFRTASGACFLFCLCFLLSVLPTQAAVKNQTRIHFICLNDSNDAILLESNGRFGMIDSGEDNDYPKGNNPKYPLRADVVIGKGYETTVINYLKKIGVKKLDFYIGTHSHSDHIGSGDEILKAFKTDRLYLNKYKDSYISNKDALWDSQYCYDNLITMAKKRGTKIIQDFSKSQNRTITLGDMNIEIMNYERKVDKNGVVEKRPDDNYFALGVKVTANGLTAFLGSDINNFAPDYDEAKLAKKLKQVDLVKLGHHGNMGSNSSGYLKTLNPSIAVITGKADQLGFYTADVLNKMGTALYSTNGQPGNSAIIADFNASEDEIVMRSPGNLTIQSKKVNNKNTLGFYNSSGKQYVRKNYWMYYNQHYYFMDETGYLLRNSWKQLDSDWYYLDAKGIMVTDLTPIKNVLYSFDLTGRMSHGGWTKGKYYWSYANSDGKAYTKGWLRDQNSWYYLGKDGIMKENCWITSKGKRYYLNAKGQMATNSFILYNNKRYYVTKDGSMLANTSMKLKGYIYRFDKNGICMNYKKV